MPTSLPPVGTPFYCYSTATLERHYRVFADAFAGMPDTLVCYSVKANSNLGVLATLATLGAGMDIVSEGELRRALAVGVAPEKIVFSGVGKTQAEMALALDAGIFAFNVESEPELRALSEVAAARGKTARIAFRVNPDVDAKTHHKIATGKAENKFGVPFAQAHVALSRSRMQLPGIEASGVHMHIGSQITDLEPFRNAFALLHELVAACAAPASPSTSSISAAGLASPIATTSRRLPFRRIMRGWCRRRLAGSACGFCSSRVA